MDGTLSQIKQKYGAKVASVEAKRRRSLVKNVGGFSNPELARAAQQKSVAKRKANASTHTP